MKNNVEKIRQRMRDGRPLDGDLSWCRQRLNALRDWPDDLDYHQEQEALQLQQWLEEWQGAA